ncbi:DUF3606 domain-containing protein [Achromobacter insolitus]|uniref:DUF3606 domain-containing protein n=2 Tax=Achromobacter insolitus TaxID=217204 RepID=UPI00398A0A47
MTFRGFPIMEDLNAAAPSERWWVNVSEPRELRYWMAVFGVSEEEIRRAVAAVGCRLRR